MAEWLGRGLQSPPPRFESGRRLQTSTTEGGFQYRTVARVAAPCHDEYVALYRTIPDLLIGFDTESTGLDTTKDEAFSYGFAVYRAGVKTDEVEYFAVPSAPMNPRAQEVHGWSLEALQALHQSGSAMSTVDGVNRTIALLTQFHREGAVFVGAFPAYDVKLFRSMARRHSPAVFRSFEEILDALVFIDVCAHDRELDPESTRSRSLPALCEHYGVQPGRHRAVGDARAAVEVFFAQVEHNRSESSLGEWIRSLSRILVRRHHVA